MDNSSIYPVVIFPAFTLVPSYTACQTCKLSDMQPTKTNEQNQILYPLHGKDEKKNEVHG